MERENYTSLSRQAAGTAFVKDKKETAGEETTKWKRETALAVQQRGE